MKNSSEEQWSRELQDALRHKHDCERYGLPVPPKVEEDIQTYRTLLAMHRLRREAAHPDQ